MRENIRQASRKPFVAALLLAIAMPVLASERWILPAAEWSRPRSGEAVAAMQPVGEAVRAWQAAGDGARLVLVHPGGEEGSLWAAELRDWLVALGVPPAALSMAPGGSPSDRLEIRLEETR